VCGELLISGENQQFATHATIFSDLMRMARGADNLRVATTRLERRELTLRFRRLLTFVESGTIPTLFCWA
jgi:hypothetical protein